MIPQREWLRRLVLIQQYTFNTHTHTQNAQSQELAYHVEIHYSINVFRHQRISQPRVTSLDHNHTNQLKAETQSPQSTQNRKEAPEKKRKTKNKWQSCVGKTPHYSSWFRGVIVNAPMYMAVPFLWKHMHSPNHNLWLSAGNTCVTQRAPSEAMCIVMKVLLHPESFWLDDSWWRLWLRPDCDLWWGKSFIRSGS